MSSSHESRALFQQSKLEWIIPLPLAPAELDLLVFRSVYSPLGVNVQGCWFFPGTYITVLLSLTVTVAV